MKPEQLLWQLIKPHVPGHGERVENAAGVGTPDVNFCVEGREGWIELKVAKTPKWTVPDLLDPEQRIWHMKRVQAGGRVFVVVRHVDGLWLYQARWGSRLACEYAPLWGSIKPWIWGLFTEHLKH